MMINRSLSQTLAQLMRHLVDAPDREIDKTYHMNGMEIHFRIRTMAHWAHREMVEGDL